MKGQYYYGGGRKFEGLIPIIILILIAVVLVGKTTNVFCSVPGLNAVFCGKGNVKIGVIGNFAATGSTTATTVTAPQLKALIDGPLGKTYGMYYEQITANQLTYAKEQILNKYDLIILVGEKSFSRPVKDAIGAYINGGGKLVVIGDAAIIDPNDPNYIGWGGGMFDAFPVQLQSTAGVPATTTLLLDRPIIEIADIGHYIVKGYGTSINLSAVGTGCATGGINILEVMPAPGVTPIALMSGNTTPTNTKVMPSIIESGSMFGGKVMYFAYDPGCTPNMWISAVGYMTGKY